MSELDDQEEAVAAIEAEHARVIAGTSPRDEDGYTQGQRDLIRRYAKHKLNEPCNCHNGIGCIHVPFDLW
jgi:hypothetical protein